ncbi:MAG: prepilin-type N-terminal cleavage/methylation domain-containing protein [Zoogloeaceae bacterium]|jgi:type IV pilus assembly protein PilE|nr:prepilin-type N-terminal cleavage/methylation domain-containing protein [Zoogloeaceae bacterium]
MRTLRQNGFSLMELMITIVIIGILTAFAYPSYQEHLRKTRRAECQGVMTSAATALERRRAVRGTYAPAAPSDPALPTEFQTCPRTTSGTIYYTVALTMPPTSASFTLTATAQGAQANDKCKNLTLTDTGIKGMSASGVPIEDCWH